jgi:hypothetical protein
LADDETIIPLTTPHHHGQERLKHQKEEEGWNLNLLFYLTRKEEKMKEKKGRKNQSCL